MVQRTRSREWNEGPSLTRNVEASQALTHTCHKQFGANKAILKVGSTYFANKAGTVNVPNTFAW
jgi:hypothetical protein